MGDTKKCDVCDRANCERVARRERVTMTMRVDQFGTAVEAARLAEVDCKAHAIDWRARALAAEDQLSRAEVIVGQRIAARLDRYANDVEPDGLQDEAIDARMLAEFIREQEWWKPDAEKQVNRG